ncbi:MAG: PEP-CTERM sorting domain-containing protein, partial [Candidatus Brocadia sp.]
PPTPVPEPISYVLFAAGGGTLMGLRYLRNRRKSKESNCQDSDVKDGIS